MPDLLLILLTLYLLTFMEADGVMLVMKQAGVLPKKLKILLGKKQVEGIHVLLKQYTNIVVY